MRSPADCRSTRPAVFDPRHPQRIRVDQRRRRAGDSNPEALARGGFQVLQTVLRLVASGSICLRFLRKTTGAFASGCVWLRLFAGVCAQECAQVLAAQGS